MVPASMSNIGSVAEATLNLVGQGDRKQKLFPAGTLLAGHRDAWSNVVTGVRGLQREVGVIIVEVSDHHSICERGQVQSSPPSGPENCSASRIASVYGSLSRNSDRLC